MLALACGGSGVNVDALAPSPPTLMIATKLQTPLYIVLDPARVKPAYEVERIGTISNMGTFVSRDLKQAMSEYFATVHVVASAAEIQAEDYVIADVKVDGFKKGTASNGVESYSVWQMTWNFALRPSDHEDYLFSFAGISQSDPVVGSWNEAVSGILERALAGLLAKWAEAETFEDLRNWEG